MYRAIAELGYTPDASARSFRTGKKKIIGFIVPDIANKFFATMIESVEKYLSANGYQLIIANTRENMEREETNVRLLTAGMVDGLLVASTMEDFQRFDCPDPHRLSGGAGGPESSTPRSSPPSACPTSSPSTAAYAALRQRVRSGGSALSAVCPGSPAPRSGSAPTVRPWRTARFRRRRG